MNKLHFIIFFFFLMIFTNCKSQDMYVGWEYYTKNKNKDSVLFNINKKHVKMENLLFDYLNNNEIDTFVYYAIDNPVLNSKFLPYAYLFYIKDGKSYFTQFYIDSLFFIIKVPNFLLKDSKDFKKYLKIDFKNIKSKGSHTFLKVEFLKGLLIKVGSPSKGFGNCDIPKTSKDKKMYKKIFSEIEKIIIDASKKEERIILSKRLKRGPIKNIKN